MLSFIIGTQVKLPGTRSTSSMTSPAGGYWFAILRGFILSYIIFFFDLVLLASPSNNHSHTGVHLHVFTVSTDRSFKFWICIARVVTWTPNLVSWMNLQCLQYKYGNFRRVWSLDLLEQNITKFLINSKMWIFRPSQIDRIEGRRGGRLVPLRPGRGVILLKKQNPPSIYIVPTVSGKGLARHQNIFSVFKSRGTEEKTRKMQSPK